MEAYRELPQFDGEVLHKHEIERFRDTVVWQSVNHMKRMDFINNYLEKDILLREDFQITPEAYIGYKLEAGLSDDEESGNERFTTEIYILESREHLTDMLIDVAVAHRVGYTGTAESTAPEDEALLAEERQEDEDEDIPEDEVIGELRESRAWQVTGYRFFVDGDFPCEVTRTFVLQDGANETLFDIAELGELEGSHKLKVIERLKYQSRTSLTHNDTLNIRTALYVLGASQEIAYQHLNLE